MKKITFFNQFHNGDCFVGKGFVTDIIRQLPDIEFSYAHKNHPDIIKDVPAKYIPITEIPDINPQVRLASEDDTIYVNTWCGAFQGDLFGYHQHSNYIIQHRIYQIYVERLSKILGREIEQTTNPHDYLPFIDFSFWPDTALADRFIETEIKDSKMMLICNGNALSGQSEVDNMKNLVKRLATENPDVKFVVTLRLPLAGPNIYYTEDIFNKACDLNEIAYLSKRANVIVGKNSGPYTFCQFKENLETPGKTFFSFNKLLTDCLTAGLEFPAQIKFSDQQHPDLLYGMLQRELTGPRPGYRTGIQHLYA